MKRVFIAINLSENVKVVLCNILENLRRVYRGAPIRFVKPDGFHVTLYFLGDKDDKTIAGVGHILDEVCKKYKKTKLSLDGFGFFPNEVRPRVLWIGAEEAGNRAIENIQKNLGKELRGLGIEIDNREWHPHITLGRISGKINTFILLSMKVSFVGWEVSSIELMESELKPEGVEYKTLHSAELS